MGSQASKYISYKLKASSKHKIHSPFVFDLMVDVFENENNFYAFPAIELIRKKLLQNSRTIEIEDLGAGSRVFKSKKRKIKEIAKHSVQSEKYAQLLFKLVNYFESDTILELGTSLGLTTTYLAKARKNATVYSLEGSASICKEAKATFKALLVKNVTLIQGNFDNTLPELLPKIESLDFVFFDGNHQREPTLRYFNQCLEKANENSIFIFDDIHWSDKMTEAWELIKKHPKVTITIDIFQLGMVFFRKGVEKQDFILRY